MIGFLLVIRNDTPKYYLTNGDEPGAITAINKIYNTRGSDAQAQRIKRFIEKSCNNNTTKVALMDAMWRDEHYARASLVNVCVMSFHALTGYSAVMSFSNTIFKNA